VVTPGFLVSAVVHAPWGAHPSPVPGYYNRDHQAFIDYGTDSKTTEVFTRWLKRWVDNIHTEKDYLQLLGAERLARLGLKHHALSEPADYGY
jgi:glutaconate CoA-transferase subunit A